MSDKLPLDKLPPNSIECEQATIGCQLLDPNACVPVVQKECNGSVLAYYDLRHQIIQESINALFRDDITIDLISLQQHLKERKLLDQCGGIAYLSQLQDAVPSAANLTFYLDVLIEKYNLRRLINVCSEVTGKIYDCTSPAEDLYLDIESTLARVKTKSSEGLPDILDACNFATKEIPEPIVLIEGMLHKGSKLVFGGSSKSHKTWCLLDLALSISMGVPWMGRHTKIGKVLYVNFEIQDFAWQYRINKITETKGKAPAPGMFNLWNLRGHAANYKVLIPKIIAKAKKEGYSLIVLDPIYKLYGGTDENAAGDVADLLNALERLATETGAAVAFGAHFSKGNPSAKEAIDRISGSGVFARDPDSILIFTKHEAEGAFTVEPILRNFAPVAPFAVRWKFPLMHPADDLDPAKLKQVGGRQREHNPKRLLRAIAEHTQDNPISISKWAIAAGIARTTLSDYLPEMRRNNWIKTIGEGSSARQAITNEGKAFINEA